VVRGDPIPQKTWKTTVDKNGVVTGRELVTEDVYPDIEMRQDAAKAVAPYYAPKLAVQYIALDQTHSTEDELKAMTPDELGAMILNLSGLANTKPRKIAVVSKPSPRGD
jgi:hypothetical protein